MWNSKPTRSASRNRARVSGSEAGPVPRYVSLVGSGDDPSLSQPHLNGKLRLGSTPSAEVMRPSPLLSRRFLRHSRLPLVKVKSYPSGLATGTNHSSVVLSSRVIAGVWPYRSSTCCISRRTISGVIHSRACCAAV